MSEEDLRLLLLGLTVLGVVGWMLNGMLVRVTGVWEKEVRDDEPKQRIRLTQSGPFISGRRLMHGGEQQFSGILFGRTIRLKRRDAGVPSLMAQGFPAKIAPLVEGQVTGYLKLTLTDGGDRLSGAFEPVRIDFTHQPPRITDTNVEPAEHVSYIRLIGVADTDEETLVQKLLHDFEPEALEPDPTASKTAD